MLDDKHVLNRVHEGVELFLVVLVEELPGLLGEAVDLPHALDVIIICHLGESWCQLVHLDLERLGAHQGAQVVRYGLFVEAKQIEHLHGENLICQQIHEIDKSIFIQLRSNLGPVNSALVLLVLKCVLEQMVIVHPGGPQDLLGVDIKAEVLVSVLLREIGAVLVDLLEYRLFTNYQRWVFTSIADSIKSLDSLI